MITRGNNLTFVIQPTERLIEEKDHIIDDFENNFLEAEDLDETSKADLGL